MERLADAFDRLDSDGKGYISKDDLKNLLGTDYNEEKVNRMIEEADFKKNGQVDYDEVSIVAVL
jgi:Ca2+-binding EF-hand superfamily protein